MRTALAETRARASRRCWARSSRASTCGPIEHMAEVQRAARNPTVVDAGDQVHRRTAANVEAEVGPLHAGSRAAECRSPGAAVDVRRGGVPHPRSRWPGAVVQGPAALRTAHPLRCVRERLDRPSRASRSSSGRIRIDAELSVRGGRRLAPSGRVVPRADTHRRRARRSRHSRWAWRPIANSRRSFAAARPGRNRRGLCLRRRRPHAHLESRGRDPGDRGRCASSGRGTPSRIHVRDPGGALAAGDVPQLAADRAPADRGGGDGNRCARQEGRGRSQGR